MTRGAGGQARSPGPPTTGSASTWRIQWLKLLFTLVRRRGPRRRGASRRQPGPSDQPPAMDLRYDHPGHRRRRARVFPSAVRRHGGGLGLDQGDDSKVATTLVAAAVWNLLSYLLVILALVHAGPAPQLRMFVATQSSTAVANTLPAGAALGIAAHFRRCTNHGSFLRHAPPCPCRSRGSGTTSSSSASRSSLSRSWP